MLGPLEPPPGSNSRPSSFVDAPGNIAIMDSQGQTTNVEPVASTQPATRPPTRPSFPRNMQPFRDPRPISYTVEESLLQRVNVYHPYYSYEEAHSPMLRFLTSDSGAQYLMVYYACCIIADNCMRNDEGRDHTISNSPFLSTTRKAEDRITVPENNIIKAGDYFFIIPDTESDKPSPRGQHYPIIPTFDDWLLPEKIPRPWCQVEVPLHPDNISPARVRETEPCYISKALNGVEQADIIPKSEEKWAKRNQVGSSLSNPNKEILSDWRNKIPLRKDLHFLWDHGYLTFFPKFTILPRTYELAIHVSRAGNESNRSYEMIEAYQNTIIRGLQGVPATFLFIRFAWSIFISDTMNFFNSRSKFKVKYLLLTDDNKLEQRCETLPKSQICRYQAGSSRYYSPRFRDEPKGKKRSRSEEDEMEDDMDLVSSLGGEDGYLSPTDGPPSSSIYDYDWASDEASEDDRTRDFSDSIKIHNDPDENISNDEEDQD
ncbi:hypothetical protein F4814DRAFT_427591 [Daldinia grandis]|nr:hypothetical protein F4814DRAFT_427591 [Daldinia grandis]